MSKVDDYTNPMPVATPSALPDEPPAVSGSDILRPFKTIRRMLFGTPGQRAQTRHLVGLALRGVDVSGLHGHTGNSGGPDLEIVMASINVEPGRVALDLGCGKGGALITLAKYGFARLDGVELSPVLASIAEKNLRKLGISNSRIVCSDATAFTDLDPYDFLYMANPFEGSIMEAALENLSSSLVRRPRRLTLVYKNPHEHQMMLRTGFVKTHEFTHSTHPFFVYSLDPASS